MSVRQVAAIAWLCLAFMVTGALVLNLRYRRLSEGAYVDTWTGELQTTPSREAVAPRAARPFSARGEIASETDCSELFDSAVRRLTIVVADPVRFAFPAPGSRAPR